jgi:hypothetical protein
MIAIKIFQTVFPPKIKPENPFYSENSSEKLKWQKNDPIEICKTDFGRKFCVVGTKN